MGIQQLLPFLSKCTEKVNISQFEGWTVAVDAYCWLHKGSYACSEELLLNTPTDKYVQYCLKFVNMLQRYKIKPVLVFDGQKLQAKSETEQQRQEKRRTAAIAARRLLLDGNRSEAKRYLGQAISVTSAMAHDVVEACRSAGVDCIVAQYEADAQLAYLSLSGIVNLIISEDSDLLVFGCRRVLFKLDLSGHGEFIEQDRLGEVFGADFSFEKFRYMCILSGCDYLDGVDGIGLSKALRVFRRAKQSDIRRVLANLSGYLGRAVTLRPGYIDEFVNANNTFLFQLVYDPIERCVQSINPRPKSLSASDFPCAGKELEPNTALNLALGNLDPYTLKPFDGCTEWRPPNVAGSIWSPNYRLPKTPPRKTKGTTSGAATAATSSSTRAVLASWGEPTTSSLNSIATNSRKRKTSLEPIGVASQVVKSAASKSELLRLYGGNNKCARMAEETTTSAAIVIDESDPEDGDYDNLLEPSGAASTLPSSPTIISQTSRLIHRNVFSVSSSSSRMTSCTSANEFFGIMTPPNTQQSQQRLGNDAAAVSSYFQPNATNHVRASPVVGKSNSSALASRLATKRLHCLQSGVLSSLSPTPTSETKSTTDQTSEDVAFVSENSTPEKSVEMLPPKETDLTPANSQIESVPHCPGKNNTSFGKNASTDNSVPSQVLQPASVKSGGAVRLLLEKFAFKPALGK